MDAETFKYLLSVGTSPLQFAILFRKVCDPNGSIFDLHAKPELIRRAAQDLAKRIEIRSSSTHSFNEVALYDMLNCILADVKVENAALINGRAKVGSDKSVSPVKLSYDFCAECTGLPCAKPFDKEFQVFHYASGNATYERCAYSRAALLEGQRSLEAYQAGIPARFIGKEYEREGELVS